MSGIARLLGTILYFYSLVFLVRALISWTPLPPWHLLVRWLERVTEPLLAPLRRHVPVVSGMDITPLVVMILLQVAGGWLSRL